MEFQGWSGMEVEWVFCITDDQEFFKYKEIWFWVLGFGGSVFLFMAPGSLSMLF